LLAGLGAPSCASYFDGPYPCLPGFASCVNPQQNMCESEIDGDALHCGSCDNQCGVGAACTSSTCGTMPTTLTTLSPSGGGGQGQQTTIAVASGTLYWAVPQSNEIMSIPTAGGAPQMVVSNANSCGTVPFAVDASNVYYWSNGNNPGGVGGPPVSGLTQVSLSTRTPIVLVPSANGGGGGNPDCGAIAVDAMNVYWVSSTNCTGGPCMSTSTISKIPIGGGQATTLGMVQTNGSVSALGVNSTSVVVQFSDNGPNQFDVFPTGGGSPTTITVNVNIPGVNAFAVDDANIYIVGSSCGCCTCNDNGGSSGGGSSGDSLPTGGVAKIPLDGSNQSVLVANFSGQAATIAVDATNVYWSTDKFVRAVPIAGGKEIQISGNLAGGQEGAMCSGCSSSPSTNGTNSIAVDGSSVYIADTNSSVNAIFKVPD